MEPEHWYSSLKRSSSRVLYNVESSPSLATDRSVASQTDRILRWMSSSRSSILSLLTWTLCRMRAVVASAARRLRSLLSWLWPERERAMPAALEGPARRAAAVHVQCPVLGCQVVLARSRRGGLGGDRQGPGGVVWQVSGPDSKPGPSAARELRSVKASSSPAMKEGGCDKLKGRRSVLHEYSEDRVRHCSGAVSAVDEASGSRHPDPLSSSRRHRPSSSITRRARAFLFVRPLNPYPITLYT